MKQNQNSKLHNLLPIHRNLRGIFSSLCGENGLEKKEYVRNS